MFYYHYDKQTKETKSITFDEFKAFVEEGIAEKSEVVDILKEHGLESKGVDDTHNFYFDFTRFTVWANRIDMPSINTVKESLVAAPF